jgi:hypothetical protein
VCFVCFVVSNDLGPAWPRRGRDSQNRPGSELGIRFLQHLQDLIKAFADLAVVAEIDDETAIAVGAGRDVGVIEEDVGHFLTVVGAGRDAKCS